MKRQELFAYVKERYGTEPDYPWARTPDYAVLRHQGYGKWYGVVLAIDPARLGLNRAGSVEILNVKCDPEWMHLLRQQPGIFPGYHMNKEHWITVLLDGTVPWADIYRYIDQSYCLTKKG